ncbi:MAG: alkyl sulfatase C-terminal domain-containing protein [Acidimicrobiales bacterium]
MATAEEIAEAYADWQERCNVNTRLARMLRGWDRTVHLVATDTGEGFTIAVSASVLSDLRSGLVDQPDLVVSATSEDFADLFWGDLNPSEKYLSGEIVLAGSSEDVMRLDAMSMVAFLDQ